MFERRHQPRVPAVMSVEIRDGDDFAIFASSDVSVGGLFFDRAIPHAVGARVHLRFTLPGERELIECDGEVANVPDPTGYGMGIRFIDVRPDDVARLQVFITTVG
ncbi:MAG: PilZ domain-containing protein [Archangium sp.]|nr:PilZ domain-containing protein [Archangium sp.]